MSYLYPDTISLNERVKMKPLCLLAPQDAGAWNLALDVESNSREPGTSGVRTTILKIPPLSLSLDSYWHSQSGLLSCRKHTFWNVSASHTFPLPSSKPAHWVPPPSRQMQSVWQSAPVIWAPLQSKTKVVSSQTTFCYRIFESHF